MVRPNKMHLNGIINKRKESVPILWMGNYFTNMLGILKSLSFSLFFLTDINKASNIVYVFRKVWLPSCGNG